MKIFGISFFLLQLTGCAFLPDYKFPPPTVVDSPITPLSLAALGTLPVADPENGRKLVIGTYLCQDTTGQRKVTKSGQADFSSAVLQDCTPLLSSAFRSYSKHYRVLERGRLDEVIKERAVAQSIYGEQTRSLIGSLLIADVLMFGQIVSYDRTTSQSTGGLAINAIGGAHEMVSDTMTFSLRAVSTKSGEILSDVLVKKTVESIQANGHILKIIGIDLYSAELGGASNEPVGLALYQAVQLSVEVLTQKGMVSGWWTN